MNYPQLALTGIGVALVASAVVYVFVKRRTTPPERKRAFVAAGITTVVLFILTAIFDSVIIGVGIVDYTSANLLGVSIGLAPIEDFSYPLAGVLLLPALWLALHRDTDQRRQDFAHLVLASRPISWINTAFPFGAAYVLITREIDWVFVVGVLFFLIPYNFAMYGINDVFDYESDRANPRKGGIEGALLSPRLHRPTLWIAGLMSAPFLIALAWAGGAGGAIAVGVSAFAVVAYSAAKLRFKERPVLDSITSSTHFVSPAVVGIVLAGGSFSTSLLILLVAFFLWGMAAHAFGAVQDIIPDREAGIRSIATVFGARSTVRLALALWTVAGLLMLFTSWPGPLAVVIALPYLVICAPYWNVTDQNSGDTNKAWRRFIVLNYFSGFFATMLMIIEWNQV